jgi:hypothetical protein
MAENIVGPHGPGVNETTERPADTSSGSAVDSWFQPCINGNPNTGTKVTAVWLNKVTALLRRAIRGMDVPDDELDDDMLLKAIQQALRGIEDLGDVGAGIVSIQAGINGETNSYVVRKIRGANGITCSIDPETGEVVVTLGGGGVTLPALGPTSMFQQERAGASAAQTFALNTWSRRQLNTVVANQIPDALLDVGGTLGQISLAAGTYRARFAGNASWNAASHQARLYNVTAGAVLAQGLTVRTTGERTHASHGIGRFTLAAPSIIEMQHYAKPVAGTALPTMGDGYNDISPNTHVDGWLELIKE